MGGITPVQDEPAVAPPPDPPAARATPSQSSAQPGPRRVRLVFLGLMLALLPAALEQMIVATALPEIARELFVSRNTLSSHTKHIFTKLGVTSRRAAVLQARERGLL